MCNSLCNIMLCVTVLYCGYFLNYTISKLVLYIESGLLICLLTCIFLLTCILLILRNLKLFLKTLPRLYRILLQETSRISWTELYISNGTSLKRCNSIAEFIDNIFSSNVSTVKAQYYKDQLKQI